MSTDRDTTRIVRSWLEEGVTTLPDRVLDTVLDQVPATAQRRRWWAVWRPRRSISALRFAGSATAMVLAVVALQGIRLFPGFGGATSIPSPTMTAISRLPADGPVSPGTYRMGIEPTFVITVPAGWESTGMGIRKHIEQPNEVTALDTWTRNIRVFSDACDSDGTATVVGATTADLVVALDAQRNTVISEPVAVTIGGQPGVRLEISAADGLDMATCDFESLQIWLDEEPGGGFLAGVGLGGSTAIVYLVDTPGGRLEIAPGRAGTAAERAERDAMIASIRFVQ